MNVSDGKFIESGEIWCFIIDINSNDQNELKSIHLSIDHRKSRNPKTERRAYESL